MFRTMLPGRTTLQALPTLVFAASICSAQINGLCDTGQTIKTAAGCTGVLVAPNPTGGGPNRDGNWRLGYPYPTPFTGFPDACLVKAFVPAWVDTPSGEWLQNSASAPSEWIMPPDGEINGPAGWYVYATSFPVPATLPNGEVPRKLFIAGQLSSDNVTFLIYLESPAGSAKCTLVDGQDFPVNNVGNQFDVWTPFSFENKLPVTAGANANLYFVVQNAPCCEGENPTGFRAEFFTSSMLY